MMFLLKHWHWIAMGALALALAGALNVAKDRGADLKTRTAERDAAVKSANDWKSAYDLAQALAAETAEAHAREVRDVANIKSAAAAAKQGAANAPGADDRFRYSDAAYGFMQPRPTPETTGGPAEADAHVDGR